MTLSVVLTTCVLICLFPDPYSSNPIQKYQGPSFEHPFGTDALGRDLLIRVVHGSATSIKIALIVGGFASFIGIIFGMTAAMSSGFVKEMIMRLTDIFLSIPSIFLLILFSTLVQEITQGKSSANSQIFLIIGMSLTSWMMMARVTFTKCQIIKEKLFITAEFALGFSKFHVVFFHILPNLMKHCIITFLVTITDSILLETGLSFLGFGIHPRTPTLGNLINNGMSSIVQYWWISLFPTLVLIIITISINYLGEGLKDAIS